MLFFILNALFRIFSKLAWSCCSFGGVLLLEWSAEVIATAVTFLAVLSRELPPPTASTRGAVIRRGPGDIKTTTWMELFLSASKGNVSEVDLKCEALRSYTYPFYVSEINETVCYVQHVAPASSKCMKTRLLPLQDLGGMKRRTIYCAIS